MAIIVGLIVSLMACILFIGLLVYHLSESETKSLSKVMVCSIFIITSFVFFIHQVIQINEPAAKEKEALIKSGISFIVGSQYPANMYNVKVTQKKVIIDYGPDFDYLELQFEGGPH